LCRWQRRQKRGHARSDFLAFREEVAAELDVTLSPLAFALLHYESAGFWRRELFDALFQAELLSLQVSDGRRSVVIDCSQLRRLFRSALRQLSRGDFADFLGHRPESRRILLRGDGN